MGNLVSRALTRACIATLHWFRLFGWVPPFLWILYRSPWRTLAGVAFYYLILSRLPPWKRLLRRFALAGYDPRFHLIKHVDIDCTNKRYLVAVHPHVRDNTHMLHHPTTRVERSHSAQALCGLKFS